jgi:predicted short-subunit dehydrogenase-like oxidoreductase (DUF2520 family)
LPRNITIIGGGRLATSLGRLWSIGGILNVQDVLCRSLSDSSRAVGLIGAGRAVTEFEDLRRADLFLISTPDGAISSAAGQLIAAGCVDESSVLFHCSGAESSELLAPARRVGATIASAHPLMTFSTQPIPRGEFAGSYCAVEGDLRAREVLEEVFFEIGAKTIEISTGQKILYHAAAIFASNYVTALLQAAIDIHGLLGIRSALSREMIAPLVRRSVDNAIAAGPREAMTGPIVRGDTELVRRQLAALAALDPGLGDLYRTLAVYTARAADVSNPLTIANR